MKHLLLSLAFLVSLEVEAAPVPVVPPGPSQEATRQIKQRRERLLDLPAGVPATPEAREIAEKRSRALQDLAAALGSDDPFVLEEAVRDVVNSQYQWFDPERVAALLVQRMAEPELHPMRMIAQGCLMEVLWRPEYRALAKPAIPGLLRMIADDKATDYTRKMAVQTAGRIGSDDPAVLKAFSEALGHKEYPSDLLTRVRRAPGRWGRWPLP